MIVRLQSMRLKKNHCIFITCINSTESLLNPGNSRATRTTISLTGRSSRHLLPPLVNNYAPEGSERDVTMSLRETAPNESAGHGHGQKTPSEKDTDAELETSVDSAKETDDLPRVEAEAEAADKYPHGGRLVVIMAALCSAMFLTALDQVSIPQPLSYPHV